MKIKNGVGSSIGKTHFFEIGLVGPEVGTGFFGNDFLGDFEMFCQVNELGFVEVF